MSLPLRSCSTVSSHTAHAGGVGESVGEQAQLPVHAHSNNAATVVAGPYRRVGNVFIVSCIDHPFKFSWEVNRMLRELRLEFMGQTVIVPDLPQVRTRLWRVRHLVRIDRLDLDEAKALVGIPEHIHFRDLKAQIAPSFGRGQATSSPVIRSKVNFMRYRRMRLRDILHRDKLEKELLEARRQAMPQSNDTRTCAPTASETNDDSNGPYGGAESAHTQAAQ